MNKEYQYDIPTGTLKLSIEEGNPNDLFNVESRKNPKRGFLFVSKVLGKHIPVRIQEIDHYHKNIAQKLIDRVDINKKTLVIGMAETATLLGYGVYKNLESYFDNNNIYYIHSTRIPNDNAIAFEESHSHAPSQFIHLEEKDYEQVILIDDELSTGNTFMNFEKILKENLPSVNKILWGCLTDFRKKEVKENQKDIKDVISLLKGEWSFEWKNKPDSFTASENINSVSPKDVIQLGRYNTINKNNDYFFEKDEHYKSLKGKTLIIGTGEFMPFPYKIAQKIQDLYGNKEIYFQATTRSPSDMKGISWDIDHYNEGVKQFLYNYNRSDYENVLLLVENEINEISINMAKLLGAKVFSLK